MMYIDGNLEARGELQSLNSFCHLTHENAWAGRNNSAGHTHDDATIDEYLAEKTFTGEYQAGFYATLTLGNTVRKRLLAALLKN